MCVLVEGKYLFLAESNISDSQWQFCTYFGAIGLGNEMVLERQVSQINFPQLSLALMYNIVPRYNLERESSRSNIMSAVWHK